MKPKNTIESLPLDGKVVFVRADLNVPLKDGNVSDDTRIKASLKTIEHLLERNCLVLLASHLGRPKGERKPEFSLKPVASKLQGFLSQPVHFVEDCIGEPVAKAVEQYKNQSCVLLLENLRYYKEETDNDEAFAKELAKHADFYINDAFGTAHRAHASTYSVATILPSAPGYLLQKEIEYIGGVISSPERPLVTILGGSKVSTKLTVLKNLLEKSEKVLVGGGMIFTFYKAQGYSIGKSLCEEDFVEEAGKLIADYKDKLILPTDVIVTEELTETAATKIVSIKEIPENMLGADIGPESEKTFSEILKSAKTVIWNGPMGVFEMTPFAHGTKSVCETLANLKDATTVVGGGDSVAAVNQMGFAANMSHISTGGGASLEFLEGKELPGVKILL
jgi:3-phosphoglycerate kinase